MSPFDIRALLDEVPDTRELVLRRGARRASCPDATYDVWADAREDARRALAAWSSEGGRDGYLAYRAAQDREDVAQDTLAAAALARRDS